MHFIGILALLFAGSSLIQGCVQTGANSGLEAPGNSPKESPSPLPASTSGGGSAAAPSISFVTPDRGVAAGATTVSIVGANFTSSSTIIFDTADSCTPTFISSQMLQCATPAHAAGTVSVTVTNGDGQFATKTSAFSFEAQGGAWSAAPTSTGSPTARRNHTAVWTGTQMLIWGGYNAAGLLNTGAKYDPATDTWTTIPVAGAPLARSSHTAVWSGTEMIVFGGYTGATTSNTGGKYDPALDTWTATTTAGAAPSARRHHTAVWTGTEMLIWGGAHPQFASFYSDGAKYDPATDTWTAMNAVGAPAARALHVAVYSGTHMVVWGGTSTTAYLDTGGVYDPVGDAWTATTATSVPTARHSHTAVWDGTNMIIWGGVATSGSNPDEDYSSPVSYLASGSKYDPAMDTWTTISSTDAPAGRTGHTAVWDGANMLIWGGYNAITVFATGGSYVSATDTWTSMSTGSNLPAARGAHTAIWDGTNMYIWGGQGTSSLLNSAGKF